MGKRIKILGLILGLGTIAFKVYNFVSYQRVILDWWGNLIILYFLMYATGIFTVVASCVKDSVSVVMSVILAVFSGLFLGYDFISWIGFMVSLNSTPMSHMGFTPVCHCVLLVANISILLNCHTKGKKLQTQNA
ncbi:MAG: hypothetical protein J5379_04190 [Clostridiales bacterium]|nr:hypothetical protein [Clostridiales bacterium]